MTTQRLWILNFFRWLKENVFVWGLLSSIYSLTAALILQPVFEALLKHEIRIGIIWSATILILLIPQVIEVLPLPALRMVNWRGMIVSPFTTLYLKHDLRRGSTWAVLAVSLGSLFFLTGKLTAIWVLVAQLPAQRALFSLYRWKNIALGYFPSSGASQLIMALWISQTVQLLIMCLIAVLSGKLSVADATPLALAAWGGILASGSVALEGDAGRPWMVNFIALSAGALGAFACLFSPWSLLLIIYFGFQMKAAVSRRLHSVEHLDEDAIIP